MNVTFRRRHILARCIALSLFIHIGLAIILQHHGIWFYPAPTPDSSPSSTWLVSMNKEMKSQILKDSLIPSSSSIKSNFIEKSPQLEEVLLSCRPTFFDPPYSPCDYLIQPPPFDASELLVAYLDAPSSLPLPEKRTMDLASHIPKDLFRLEPEEPLAVSSSPASPCYYPEKPIAFQPVLPSPEFPAKATEEDLYAELLAPSLHFPQVPLPPAQLHPELFASLPDLPTLEELNTSSYSDEFDVDLVFRASSDQEGYIFALTLIPKENLHIAPLKQHFIFLIDRANSIQRERLISTKQALLKAIEQLQSEDTFNIIAFDNKMEKLFPSQMQASASSKETAKEFIQKIELGSFFSPADLYRPLLMTVPSRVLENEMYTAILLTDGDFLTKKSGQLSLLQEWSRYNQGKVNLHILTIAGDKQISALEALSALNGGQCIQSATKRGLKRKILKLMKTIQMPLIKHISCHAFSRSPHAMIKIYPENTRSQPLYLGQPYTILGTAETLDDFVFFIQGRFKDRWLNIKKNISFISARKGDPSLETEWAWQKVYDLYEQYLIDKNPEHLTKLKTLIDPLHLPLVFQ